MEWRLLLRVGLLLFTLSTPALVIIQGWAELLVFLVPIILYLVVDLIRFLRQAQEELNQFIESVHYRDFSRFFNERTASAELLSLRRGFNEINTTIKSINREKEIEHQHMQKILELVNTGIITFNQDSGDVLMMNEALKQLLHVPFMKSIHALQKRDRELYTEVLELQPGSTKIATAHTTHFEKSTFKVFLSATAFQSDGQKYKLVAFQNVSEALDETESKAWEKLLNVMTHEIMNSVAPISSLASTLKERLHESINHGATPEDMEDLEVGISTIKRRSDGLLKFAATYRNLSKITKLNLESVYIKDIFANLHRLMQPTLAQKNITLDITLKDPHLSLQADTNLLDQALINLLVNAIEAVKERPDPTIVLSAYIATDGKKVIKVTDNGIGMPKEIQEKIYIPFFSTRKQGSGIGLSLCKQIVMLHGGTIQVQSEEGVGTAFLLRFS
ncbi:HAMP domain-containing sensor histidine kinase [Pontibacter korlensis]